MNLFWCYWWPASFLVYPLLGRVWCADELGGHCSRLAWLVGVGVVRR